MRNIILILSLVSVLSAYSQVDNKPVVGVNKFTSENNNATFANSVYEKVVQVITNTHRFILIDIDGTNKTIEELKSEKYLDSKNAQKNVDLLTMQSMIIGHLGKMNIFTMKNPDGSINGYKASAAFNLKVQDIGTGKVTEAAPFQTEVSPLAMSKEQAVNLALKSVEPALNAYFSKEFPLITNIVKILSSKKDAAATLLIAGGKSFGFKENGKLIVERIEMLNGKPYPSKIGELKITKIAGDNFSECIVLSGGKEILTAFNAAEKLNCKLLVE
ncbi:MAG: penicillin-binding protein activator LpoB [Bacteroidetes bacterium]|nr:penicillin-binding protein activator LpoB [Bacteroidota bacterium]